MVTTALPNVCFVNHDGQQKITKIQYTLSFSNG